MSLSIGVVNITYLDQPGQPMYRFMWDLMADPEVGLGADRDENDGWWDGGSSGENAFYEFTRDGMLNRASGWADAQTLSDRERSTLLDWVENLPYRDDTIMLHLSF